MPTRKVLKSVSRSVADSFTSLMNWGGNDYVMGHILRAARASGEATLEVDMLTGRSAPEALLTPAVRNSIEGYCSRLPSLVTNSGSDPNFVTAASMSVTFDLSIANPVPGHPSLLQSPYMCSVRIEDDRGKVYESIVNGWWYPES